MQQGVWQELIEQATRETTTARQRLMRHRLELDQAETQQKQLKMFRQDYADQASAAGGRMSLSRLMHLRAFIDNLDVAIAQLSAQIEHLHTLNAEAQARLSERRARQLALEKLVSMRTARQASARDRREQAAIDDLIQAHAHRSR
ncbi:MAG: flagellar FliJ family protein [Pseudomonadota bacterium]